MNEVDDEIITLEEAQELLNVDEFNFRRIIASGRITTYKVGSKLRVDLNSLKSYLKCSNQKMNCIYPESITASEREMIADWT